MSERTERLQRYEDVVQRLAGAMKAVRLYSAGHPMIRSLLSDLPAVIGRLHADEPSILIGFVGGEIIADDTPLGRVSANRSDITRELGLLGIQRILIERGVTTEELETFIDACAKADPSAGPVDAEFVSLPHLRAGRIPIDASGPGGAVAASVRQVYQSAVAAAATLWESALTEGKPDLPTAQDTVAHLTETVASNHWVLLGLTSMKEHDDYTYTHMVNVAILTLAQARALDIEGTRLRELGIAALLHDIGKIRTPREILTSTVPLTDREFAIIKQHPVDGASLLRCTPGMPAIVPIVALEHHLRLDGAGYPERSSRPSLNLGTMLCAIADVYDAMRSSRSYQRSHPPDRIIGVLRKNDGRQFDQRLVDRFVRLMGIYPPGTMVQLTSGEVGVVQQTNDGDVRQPTVRLLVDRKGVTIPSPHTRTLWRESDDEAARLARAVDPALYRIDLLPHMVNG